MLPGQDLATSPFPREPGRSIGKGLVRVLYNLVSFAMLRIHYILSALIVLPHADFDVKNKTPWSNKTFLTARQASGQGSGMLRTLLEASRPKGLGERHHSVIFHQQHTPHKAMAFCQPRTPRRLSASSTNTCNHEDVRHSCF
jgi:hypothetical protein